MGTLPLALQSIVAFLLWWLAPTIGRRMVRGLAEPEADKPLSSSWVAGLVFSLAGVILIGLALPSLIQRAVEYWMALGFDQTIWNRRIALLAPPLIQFGLGVWLVLTPEGLVRLLQWRVVEDIDDGGLDEDEKSSD